MPNRYYTQDQVKKALIDAGANKVKPYQKPTESDILSAIAMIEGGEFSHPDLTSYDKPGDVELSGVKNEEGQTWGASVTCWQIRTIVEETGTGSFRDILWLLEDIKNGAQAALYIFRKQGPEAWTTFRNKAYRAYMQDYFPPPPGYYLPRIGDTFYRIAQKFDIDPQVLMDLNPDQNLLPQVPIKLPEGVVNPLAREPEKKEEENG